jgi:hypothetical protein
MLTRRSDGETFFEEQKIYFLGVVLNDFMRVFSKQFSLFLDSRFTHNTYKWNKWFFVVNSWDSIVLIFLQSRKF